MYLEVDQKHMKILDEEYNVKVGYWALKNNVKEYKVYATLIWMFDLDFVNFVISSWGQFVTNRINKPQLHDPFSTLSRISIGDKQSGPIFIGSNHM